MEAGARQYRFEEIETGEVVEAVVAGFADQLATSGRRIDTCHPPAACPITADAEASDSRCANLVDNALKYSPASRLSRSIGASRTARRPSVSGIVGWASPRPSSG